MDAVSKGKQGISGSNTTFSEEILTHELGLNSESNLTINASNFSFDSIDQKMPSPDHLPVVNGKETSNKDILAEFDPLITFEQTAGKSKSEAESSQKMADGENHVNSNNASAPPGQKHDSEYKVMLKSKSSDNVSEHSYHDEKAEEDDEMANQKKMDTKFSFPKFLEKWKKPEALPLTLLVKKFTKEFISKPMSVAKQSQAVQDFLLFMEDQLPDNPLWKDAPPTELDHAIEGIEKSLMNKLYEFTFSPRGSDDTTQDEVIHRKMEIFRWVEPRHFDIKSPPHLASFYVSAQEELLKLNKYKAPRDKIICILNCCKVIFGLLKKMGGDSGADVFFTHFDLRRY